MVDLNSIQDDITGFITDHPIESAIGAGVIGAGVGAATVAIIGKATSRKTSKSRKKSSKRGRSRDRMFKSKQKWERKYKRKRKYKVYGHKGYINPKAKHKRSSSRKSKRGIHYTKNGQPYKILASGKARFIKK
jgi:hypothetical protein